MTEPKGATAAPKLPAQRRQLLYRAGSGAATAALLLVVFGLSSGYWQSRCHWQLFGGPSDLAPGCVVTVPLLLPAALIVETLRALTFRLGWLAMLSFAAVAGASLGLLVRPSRRPRLARVMLVGSLTYGGLCLLLTVATMGIDWQTDPAAFEVRLNHIREQVLSVPMARLRGTAAACAELLDVVARRNCLESVAVRNHDPRPCDLLEYESVAADCYRASRSAATVTIEHCADLKRYASLRDDCFGALARRDGDPAACHGITEAAVRDQCFADLAETGALGELCDHIGDEQRKAACRESAPTAEFCRAIQRTRERGDCFQRLAVGRKDASFCEQIDHGGSKQNCYSLMAHELDDPTLCDRNRDPVDRDNCRQSLRGR